MTIDWTCERCEDSYSDASPQYYWQQPELKMPLTICQHCVDELTADGREDEIHT